MGARQISANVSEETGKLIDDFADAHGLKKGFLIESALRHHLQALRELPADVIVPPRVVVSGSAMRTIAELLERPGTPTDEMRSLMQNHTERAAG